MQSLGCTELSSPGFPYGSAVNESPCILEKHTHIANVPCSLVCVCVCVCAQFGAVLRAEAGSIKIGARSNVQDNVVVHTDANCHTVVGEDVTLGHSAIIHGAEVPSSPTRHKRERL
jgi:hypothetical protein